jgi:hypothetical protein
VVTTSITTPALKWPSASTAQLVVSIRRRADPARRVWVPPVYLWRKASTNGHVKEFESEADVHAKGISALGWAAVSAIGST